MKDNIVNLLSGAFCGMTVDSIIFPLDTIKTRFQAQQGTVTVSKYKHLFNGLGTILMGSVPASAAYWCIYENVKNRLQEMTNNNHKLFPLCEMIAASMGEIVSASIRNPFEVTKQFIQVKGYSNPLKAILEISKERGFGSLYSGYRSMLMRDIPFDMIEFVLYEAEKRYVEKHKKNGEIPLYINMLMGCFAGGVAAFITCPLDVLKTRIMLSANLPAHKQLGIRETGTLIVRQEGWKKLFAGVTPRVVWISLGGSLWFGAFEEYRRILSRF